MIRSRISISSPSGLSSKDEENLQNAKDRYKHFKRMKRKQRLNKGGTSRIIIYIAVFMALVPFAVIFLILNRGVESHSETSLRPEKSSFRGKSNIATSSSLKQNSEPILIAGIVRDASKIHDDIWSTIIELNCNHQMKIHLLASQGTGKAMTKRENLKKKYTNHDCASFDIIKEDNSKIYGDTLSTDMNRIDKISFLRDYQRKLLLEQYSFQETTSHHPNGVVIIMDFDLWRLPEVNMIKNSVQNLQNSSYPHDVLCSAGVTTANRNDIWYYDMFSTVLLPDTFVYPLSRRLINKNYPGEDVNYVRSDKKNGPITQGDLMRHFVSEAKKSPTKTFSVKSCFGGFAMYRSDVYFRQECSYVLSESEKNYNPKDNNNHGSTLMKYASKKDKRPCEHVVFHNCLKNLESPSVDIAISPGLITLWAKDR